MSLQKAARFQGQSVLRNRRSRPEGILVLLLSETLYGLIVKNEFRDEEVDQDDEVLDLEPGLHIFATRCIVGHVNLVLALLQIIFYFCSCNIQRSQHFAFFVFFLLKDIHNI